MPTLINNGGSGVRVFKDYHPNIADDSELENFQAPQINDDDGKMDPEFSKSADSMIMAARKFNYGPKQHYQWSTKNKSFIQLHNDLKQLGIKNNKFFLRLYDTTLEGVDYFNPFMPLEMQARVFRECVVNPWFYLREICRVPVDGKPIIPGGGAPFAIDRNSVASWLLFLNGISHFCSKPRQKGKTIDALSKINYAYHFGSLAGNFTFGNKDFQLNKMNLARLKTMRDLLPSYLQMKVAITTETKKFDKGTENVTMMQNPITKNSIILLPSASTADKADGIGRGYTAAIQFWDEFEWAPHNTRIIKAAAPAYKTASDNAKANGSVYCRIFTSTPGNLDSPAGQSAEEFIRGSKYGKGMLVWEDRMLDTPMKKIKQLVESPAYNGVVFVEHSWQQLKCTMEWYELQCQGVNYDPEQIAREIQLKRLRGTSRSPFNRNEIMNLINGIVPHISSVDLSENLSPIYFYEPLKRNIPYIIAIDTAEGLKGDNTTMIVINPYTEKIAAEFKSPFIRQDKMGKMVINFMMRYCPRSLVVVENNRGRECMHVIQDSPFGSRLWYDVDDFGGKEKINQKDNWDREKALGFNTNKATRSILMSTLEALVKEEPEKINGKFVVDDICALEKTNTGRIQAASGKHDDCVMAYLIGMTVFRQASNLDEWGIYRGMRQHEEDENTPEAKAKKINELIMSLPTELRKLFTPPDKDPIQESIKYAKEVNRGMEMAGRPNANYQPYDDLFTDDSESDYFTNPASEDDFVDDILSMRDQINESSNNFDIDDYL